MGRAEFPSNFSDYATRSYAAVIEASDGLDWWLNCITSTLVDLVRVEGFITAFVGIAQALRHGDDPDRVAGGPTVEEAIGVALEWLDADINPTDVGGWIQAGCWNPLVARRLVAAGIQPRRLLDGDGNPIHWIEAPDGETVPLARAVVEWELPVADVVEAVTGSRYEGGPRRPSVLNTNQQGDLAVYDSPLTPQPYWRTSSFSDGLQCVAVAELETGRIGIKSSKRLPDYSPQEFAAFINGVKAGEFDDLAGLA